MTFRCKFRLAILLSFFWHDSVANTLDKTDITIEELLQIIEQDTVSVPDKTDINTEELLQISEQDTVSVPAFEADLTTEDALHISEQEAPGLEDVLVAISSFQDVLGPPGHSDWIEGNSSNATVKYNPAECSNSVQQRVENPLHSGALQVHPTWSTIINPQRYELVDTSSEQFLQALGRSNRTCGAPSNDVAGEDSDKDSDPVKQNLAKPPLRLSYIRVNFESPIRTKAELFHNSKNELETSGFMQFGRAAANASSFDIDNDARGVKVLPRLVPDQLLDVPGYFESLIEDAPSCAVGEDFCSKDRGQQGTVPVNLADFWSFWADSTWSNVTNAELCEDPYIKPSLFDIDPISVQVFSPRFFDIQEVLDAPGFSNKIHPTSPSIGTVAADHEWMKWIEEIEGENSVSAFEPRMAQLGCDGAFDLKQQSYSVAPPTTTQVSMPSLAHVAASGPSNGEPQPVQCVQESTTNSSVTQNLEFDPSDLNQHCEVVDRSASLGHNCGVVEGEPQATMQEQPEVTIDISALHPAVARPPHIRRLDTDYVHNSTMTGQESEEELRQQAEDFVSKLFNFSMCDEFSDDEEG